MTHNHVIAVMFVVFYLEEVLGSHFPQVKAHILEENKKIKAENSQRVDLSSLHAYGNIYQKNIYKSCFFFFLSISMFVLLADILSEWCIVISTTGFFLKLREAMNSINLHAESQGQ